MKIMLIAGARPNFMKIAPLWSEMKRYPNFFQPLIVHTGQHYDENMSDAFFKDLELPKPDIYLGVGSGSHAEQTAKIMIKFEKICLNEEPNLVIVVGDVNSTLACSIVTAKLCIPVAHVEAGLRSFDRTMPEEINREVTDSLSDFLFTTCEDANENLRREGIPGDKIHFVGNVMIDTLLKFKAKAQVKAKTKRDIRDYALLTLHRPSNVDNAEIFKNILEALQRISKEIPIIFPAHPRTQKQVKFFGYERYFDSIELKPMKSINPKNSINLLEPLPYLEFLSLMANAKMVLTDSGGIQEETTILGIPCLTLRENTERPITITQGTNVLVGTDKKKIVTESLNILNGDSKIGKVPKLWDGKAAERIVQVIKEISQ
jgi:UDP-N-acetylglucosamine 2-epimerase (non-hydrolysing)